MRINITPSWKAAASLSPRGAPNKEGAIAALHTFRYTMLSDEYRRSLYERDIENGYWTEELQKEMEKNALCDAGVLRNWEGFGMGDHYSDIYSRPSSGEPLGDNSG